jgi:hypothetical protein
MHERARHDTSKCDTPLIPCPVFILSAASAFVPPLPLPHNGNADRIQGDISKEEEKGAEQRHEWGGGTRRHAGDRELTRTHSFCCVTRSGGWMVVSS